MTLFRNDEQEIFCCLHDVVLFNDESTRLNCHDKYYGCIVTYRRCDHVSQSLYRSDIKHAGVEYVLAILHYGIAILHYGIAISVTGIPLQRHASAGFT